MLMLPCVTILIGVIQILLTFYTIFSTIFYSIGGICSSDFSNEHLGRPVLGELEWMWASNTFITRVPWAHCSHNARSDVHGHFNVN